MMNEDVKAFESAVIDLEKQDPCDCVSRQAVINAIANTCFWLSAGDWNELMECINSTPPVTPQLKTGKWLSHYDYCKKHGLLPSGLFTLWWCDQCEQGVEHPTNFCPRCGAKMEVDK